MEEKTEISIKSIKKFLILSKWRGKIEIAADVKLSKLTFIELHMLGIWEAKRIRSLILLNLFVKQTISNEKCHTHKLLRDREKENTKKDDKQINKDIAVKMINSFYFTDRILNTDFHKSLDSHQINHFYT